MDRRVASRESRGTYRPEKLDHKNTPALAVDKEREEKMVWRKFWARTAGAVLVLFTALPAFAQKQYGPGVTDKEIKIGTTTPFSGPASAYSAGAISATAYFQTINDQGGVNGRKINYLALDDAYSPPQTVA